MDVPRGTPDDLMQWLVGQWEDFLCTACGKNGRRRVGSNVHSCEKCSLDGNKSDAIAQQAAQVEKHKAAWVERYLEQAGLSQRERSAQWGKVNPRLMALMTNNPGCVTLLGGEWPVGGFGLCGGAGVGKTFALASMMRVATLQYWKDNAPHQGRAATRMALSWVRWPEVVNQWRVTSTREGGLDDVAALVKRIQSMPLVVLDDLGAERMRGGYVDDWAASQLDLIVDRRYNDMLPTWYTSNMNKAEFLERYGARLCSRLCGVNPFIEVGAGPDLRVLKGGS